MGITGGQIKGLSAAQKEAAIKLMLGVCCWLQEGVYDEQLVVLILANSLASGPASILLTPSRSPCFHEPLHLQDHLHLSLTDQMNETNAPGGGTASSGI